MNTVLSRLKKQAGTGWTAVNVGEDGLYGVTVLPPQKPGSKPRVIKSSFVQNGDINSENLTALSNQISVPGCPWTLSLPRKDYHILVTPEPPVDSAELDQTIRWSIINQIDYPVEESNISWMTIPTTSKLPNRSPHLYVMVARADLMADLNGIFQHSRLHLEAIDVRETAQRNIATLSGAHGEGLALLVVGTHGIHFTISLDGELYLDRYVEETLFNDDDSDSGSRERVSERIVLQVQRSLDFVSRTLPFIEINRILLAPMQSDLGLHAFIAQNVQVPVEVLDLSTLFDFSETPDLMLKENQARYFYALGSALRFINSSEGPVQQINLIARKKTSSRTAWEFWGGIAALLLVTVFHLGTWFHNRGVLESANREEASAALELKAAEMRLHTLTLEISHGKDMDAEIAALKPRAEAASYLLSNSMNLGSDQGYARHFDALTQIPEDGLWITSVTVSKTGKSMSISGNAFNKESVLRYAKRLNAIFADDGVQFTSIELSPVTAVSKADGKPQLTAVFFKLG